ncbi:MAG: gamma-glutamyl-gamma-aminobutyrate hydrolase family protein [Alphaproteobacteria bacterium]|nr:gamma-glutamyl-gamma-aminobutyrate hydrolase family protein [Alphaproteobacteria bacterium]MBF0333905.1 gamma-glutamyl-gamma-aminobutyrate hydrolase family protein [Alphaproteobacteria bacterium]
MRPVLITQRVDVVASHGERRDALDQRWPRFLAACGFLALPVPNDPAIIPTLVETLAPAGIVFSGGNDLACLGGDVPERDAVEAALLDFARRRGLPVLGVCRGTQFLLDRLGARVEPVAGHVAVRHPVGADGMVVNSYHAHGARRLAPPLETLATSPDGVVEAFRHGGEAIGGVMWHPEREEPFSARDIAMVREFLEAGTLRIRKENA